MKNVAVGFVGGGRVVRIFLQAWTRAQTLPDRVVVADPNAATLALLQQRFPSIEATTDLKKAAAQDVVFLATHPPVLADATAAIAMSLAPEAIVVSLAPKITLTKLSLLLAGFTRVARANPNAPSVVGAGLNPIAFGPALPNDAREKVRALFEPLGDSPEVPEAKIEAYAVLTAMGPTYLWFQLQTLRELARAFGLTPTEADVALERMACGAVRTLVESGLPPAEVMDMVPVKPLAEMESLVTNLYRERLPAVFERIKP